MWGQSRELMPGEEMGSSFLGSGEGGGRLRWRQVSWQHLGVKGIQLPRKALAKGSDRKTRSWAGGPGQDWVWVPPGNWSVSEEGQRPGHWNILGGTAVLR